MRTAGDAESTPLGCLHRSRIRRRRVIRGRTHTCQLSRRMSSGRKAEMHHIAVRNYVIFTFQPHFPGIASARFAAAGNEVVISDGFRPYEAALEISMNDTCRLRRLGTLSDSPCARFLRADREIGYKVE